MTHGFPSIQRRTIPRRLHIVSFCVGAVLVAILIHSLYLGTGIAGQYAILVDAAKEIRYQTSSVYLLYERNGLNIDEETLGEIEEIKERSEVLHRLLLEGGDFYGKHLVVVEDFELRGKLYDLREKQNDVYEALEDRLHVLLTSGSDVGLNGPINHLYQEFVLTAEQTEERMTLFIDDELNRFKAAQWFLVFFTISCVGVSWIGLNVFLNRREKQNQKLKESEDRFRQLLNNARDMVLLIDAESERVVEVNMQTCSALGYSDSELHALSLSDLDKHSSVSDRKQNGSYYIAGRSFVVSGTFTRRDGTEIPVESNVAVIERDGRLFWLAVVRDVSDWRRMETDLVRAKQHAEDANKAKSAFLANMSHEVRTPINGIMGMLQLLDTTPMNTEQSEYIEIAVNSCRTLTSILSDILDLSRVEAGKVELEEESFLVEDLLNSVDATFRAEIESRDISLDFEAAENLPLRLIGDSVRLKQILINLVGNAVKFTTKGGIVVQVDSRGTENGTTVQLDVIVSDTGMGIPQSQIKHIFEAFRQVDGSYTRKHQGVGLGLSIVKKLVDLMGGRIAITSQEGVGTKFKLSIPFKFDVSGGPVQETLKMDFNGLEGRRALVVDDHKINLMSASQILKRMGIETSCACNGKEALSILQSKSFDFALMDIQMPEMDGIMVTQEIRNNKVYDSQTLPIIAMTAHSMTGDREKFLSAGMSEYVSKPFEMKELRDRIERVLDENSH